MKLQTTLLLLVVVHASSHFKILNEKLAAKGQELQGLGMKLVNFELGEEKSKRKRTEASTASPALPTSSASSAQATTTISSACVRRFDVRSQADVEQFVQCPQVKGDVVVSNYTDALLNIEPLAKVYGSFVVRDLPLLVRIEASKLEAINGSLTMERMTRLATVLFPSLGAVRLIYWRVLPLLNAAAFYTRGIRGLESLTIADTSLPTVAGFSSPEMATVSIHDNRFLETILADVRNITGSLHVAANANHVLVDLSHLRAANNLTVQGVRDINLGELSEVHGSASIIANDLQRLKLPKLARVGGTFSLLRNDELAEVELPELEEVGGGFVVANNSQIERIDFVPKLRVIGGALELVGHIRETSMAALRLVKGSAKIYSLAPLFNCARWANQEINHVVRGGKVECVLTTENESYVSEPPMRAVNASLAVRMLLGGVRVGSLLALGTLLALFAVN